MLVDGKVIWITGASSGIGKALAMALSRRSCDLILSSRRQEALEEVKSQCQNQERIRILPLDLEKIDELDAKAKAAQEFFGRVDILINNGGISQRSLAMETELEVFSRLMTINYLGSVALSKALLPGMVKRGQGLHVAVTSLVGKFGTPLRSGYSASKHALHGFYDSLRAEVSNQGVEVLLVCPGFIKTNVSINAFTADGSKQGTMDDAQEKGMPADVFAKKCIAAIESGREEVNIGGKERFGVFIKRFFPSLFSKMVKTAKVT